MRLLIMGAPGAGKGTQAVFIKQKYNIPHISTGDMFREAIASGTELGKIAKMYIDDGHLVPDEYTIALIKERLSRSDCANGFILDGYPRTLAQVLNLEELLQELNISLDAVLYIDIDQDLLVERICGRMVCPKCGASYHEKFAKPKVDGICDLCGSALVHRKDDTKETIGERINIYLENTKPLLSFYEQKGLLKKIDGSKARELIFEDIINVLE